MDIKFNYKEEEFFFSGNSSDVFKEIVNWLYSNGYDFNNRIHKTKNRKIYSKSEIIKSGISLSRFHNIKGSDFYIPVTVTGNIENRVRSISLMLNKFGVSDIEIKKSKENKEISKFNQFKEEVKKRENPSNKQSVY